MTNEQERDALRKLVRGMDHTARSNCKRASAWTAEQDSGSAADQVEHYPAKSTEVPSLYAVGSQRGPKSVQLHAAYRNLAMELTEWHH